jgi:hypothetical protein
MRVHVCVGILVYAASYQDSAVQRFEAEYMPVLVYCIKLFADSKP